MNVPYISGTSPPPELPLGRFLPPIPTGMFAKWCENNLKPGDWILDPFGFSPLIPIEIASAGFNILVTVNNPIHAFILQILSSAPSEEELIAALQELATATKGDSRMEPYIRNFYIIHCANCHHEIEAKAFLWQKGADQPYAAEVDCPFCGAQGIQNLDAEALSTAAPLPLEGLHRARALNRIAERNDPLRPNVEATLNAYPSRSLIILQTIINKIDNLDLTPRRKDLLIALILIAADHGNTLWAYPSPRERPKQIVVPAVYREPNLWLVMEDAVHAWELLKEPVPCFEWKNAQESPQDETAIYYFKGRLKDLDPASLPSRISATVTAIPRPNQAFWSLSALWAGWIWGQEGVLPIRNVLARQRYDWNWHTNALSSIFLTLADFPEPQQQIWGLITENEPLFLLTGLLAANSSGYTLSGFAQSEDDNLAQCLWRYDQNRSIKIIQPEQALKIGKSAVETYLTKKGEPATYQQVHAASVTGLAHRNELVVEIFLQNKNQFTSETQKLIEAIFRERNFLIQVGDETTTLEAGDWWLTKDKGLQFPLADRVEDQIVNLLVSEEQITSERAKAVVFQALPGLFTPEENLILNCLESYADLIDRESHFWKLRENELPGSRRKDIREIVGLLQSIGEKLAYKVQGQDPLCWFEEENDQPIFSFHVFSSAMVYKHLAETDKNAQTKMMVFPGSRANLLAFKKQRDPVLRNKLFKCCLEVKFRLIRDLAANPLLSRELFLEQIKADPPEYHASQLALF